MRKFAVLAVAAAALAFAAPSTAHAQVVVTGGTSYYNGYPGVYSPYGYGGTGVYGNNFGVVQSGYGVPNYGYVQSYPIGGYRTYSYPAYNYPAYNRGFNNYGSYNRGFNNGGYGNRGYARGGYGGRRR